MKFGIGQPVRRFEDQTLITGKGRYTDDMRLPHRRRPTCCARRRARQHPAHRYSGGAQDARRAAGADRRRREGRRARRRALPAPLNNRDGSPRHDTPRPLLAIEQGASCRPAGRVRRRRDLDAGAGCRGSDRNRLRDAARRHRRAAPRWSRARRNCSTAFRATSCSTGTTTRATSPRPKRRSPRPRMSSRSSSINNRVVANSMEPRNAIGDWDAASGRSVLYTGDAGLAFRARSARRGRAEDSEGETARHHAANVGGGFGMKAFVYPEQALVVWAAASSSGRCKWQSDRSEGFISDNQGRDHVTRAELALDAKRHVPRLARLDHRQSRRLSLAVGLVHPDALDRPRLRASTRSPRDRTST